MATAAYLELWREKFFPKPRRLKWGSLCAEKAVCESLRRIYKLRRAADPAGMDSLRRPRARWAPVGCTGGRLCPSGCGRGGRGCRRQVKPVGIEIFVLKQTSEGLHKHPCGRHWCASDSLCRSLRLETETWTGNCARMCVWIRCEWIGVFC